ncbi:MAG: hypothetical protein ACOCRX_00295 [Candidatus Woesearchaeota archaeon]
MKKKFIKNKNKIHNINKETQLISIKNSIFQCSGGGQDEDEGEIYLQKLDKTFKVNPIKKNKDITKLKIINQNQIDKIKKGMIIEERVNWDIREIHSRTHTAEHLLFSQMKKTNKKNKIKLLKVDIKKGFGDIYIKTDLKKEELFNQLKLAQENTNELIQEGRKVKVHTFKKNKIDKLNKKFPDIRIKKNKIKEDIIKVVEIDKIDYSACKGTHVNNISKIRQIGIIDINKNNEEYKIRFTVNLNEIINLKDILLRFKLINNIQLKDLNERYQNLIKEKKHFRDKMNKLLPLIWKLSTKTTFKDKKIKVVKIKNFNVNKLMSIINNKNNFLIINVTNKGTNIISKGINLNFINDYKGKMSKEKSILFVNDKTRKKIEKKINDKELSYTI